MAEFSLPHQVSLSVLVAEAFALLNSADAETRDGLAYSALATWLETGHLDEQLDQIGERSCQLLGAPESHTRSFAALILAEVIARDAAVQQLNASQLREWQEIWATWYLHERDLRGWVADTGWVHALAHGADVAAQFARHPLMEGADLNAVLNTLILRIGSVYELPQQWEEDRVALAAFLLFNRSELSSKDLENWLDGLQDIWQPQYGQPRSVAAAFAVQVARSLLVFAHLGLQPPGGKPIPAPLPDALQKPLLVVLKTAFPAYPD